MDRQLKTILEAFLKLMRVLNDEVTRLSDTSQFDDHPQCLQLVEEIRSGCADIFKTMNLVERRIYAQGLVPPEGE